MVSQILGFQMASGHGVERPVLTVRSWRSSTSMTQSPAAAARSQRTHSMMSRPTTSKAPAPLSSSEATRDVETICLWCVKCKWEWQQRPSSWNKMMMVYYRDLCWLFYVPRVRFQQELLFLGSVHTTGVNCLNLKKKDLLWIAPEKPP